MICSISKGLIDIVVSPLALSSHVIVSRDYYALCLVEFHGVHFGQKKCHIFSMKTNQDLIEMWKKN